MWDYLVTTVQVSPAGVGDFCNVEDQADCAHFPAIKQFQSFFSCWLQRKPAEQLLWQLQPRRTAPHFLVCHCIFTEDWAHLQVGRFISGLYRPVFSKPITLLSKYLFCFYFFTFLLPSVLMSFCLALLLWMLFLFSFFFSFLLPAFVPYPPFSDHLVYLNYSHLCLPLCLTSG